MTQKWIPTVLGSYTVIGENTTSAMHLYCYAQRSHGGGAIWWASRQPDPTAWCAFSSGTAADLAAAQVAVIEACRTSVAALLPALGWALGLVLAPVRMPRAERTIDALRALHPAAPWTYDASRHTWECDDGAYAYRESTGGVGSDGSERESGGLAAGDRDRGRPSERGADARGHVRVLAEAIAAGAH